MGINYRDICTPWKKRTGSDSGSRIPKEGWHGDKHSNKDVGGHQNLIHVGSNQGTRHNKPIGVSKPSFFTHKKFESLIFQNIMAGHINTSKVCHFLQVSDPRNS